MASLDIFRSDPFSTFQMTSAIERLPYQPDGIDALGVFTDNPIRTTAVGVEERNGVLSVIPISERHTPPNSERTTERREMRYFQTKRIVQGDTIWADEIQNIREFGQETELMQVMTEAARRLSGPTGLIQNIRYTHENMRLAAVKGILVDADGSSIYNWYDEFGFQPALPFYFDLATATANTLRPLINKMVRGMARSSKGAFRPNTKVYALCGDLFWDLFTNHPDVIRTFLNWNEAREIRDGDQGAAFSTFRFGGVEWVNYRGSDDNSTIKIADNEVEFFSDAPGVFERTLAPAETIEWVNTPGKEFYVIPIFDRDRNMWFRNEVYSYPLFICKRPDTLRKGFADALGGHTQGGADIPVETA
jgi:hypothetical protein